jgi:hypothetical protein
MKRLSCQTIHLKGKTSWEEARKRRGEGSIFVPVTKHNSTEAYRGHGENN